MSQGQRPLKITLVGAGSVVFTRKLLGDILSRPELPGCHIALHDIDEHPWALSAQVRTVKTVGLCHSVQNTAEELAHDLGLPVGEIDCHCAGIKHMAFFLRFDHRGESLIPRLRRLMDEGRVPATNRVRYEILRRLGYFVTESSEHFSEYVPWFIKPGRADLLEHFNIPLDEYPGRFQLVDLAWPYVERELKQPGSQDPQALQRKPEHVYHAAMLDPHTAAVLDLDQIHALVGEMLAAHRPWLPDSLQETAHA